jgi:hypothetical protein
MTRGSITGQVKALSMIVAMQNFIPDRLATPSDKKSVPATNHHGSTAPNFVIPPAPARRGRGADLSRPAVEGPAGPGPRPPRSPATRWAWRQQAHLQKRPKNIEFYK